ncbi:hypothetical protein ACQEVF_19015 [Nonomuraea polychroma]|uniref:hypothetical protein n=1 Tax=Nonomuraea polychroma TaxID=46176 RepID=UPI003D8A3862
MTRLRDLRNLGPKSEEWLALNALWAMEGVVTGVDWRRHIRPSGNGSCWPSSPRIDLSTSRIPYVR